MVEASCLRSILCDEFQRRETCMRGEIDPSYFFPSDELLGCELQ